MKDIFLEVWADIGPYPEEPWENVIDTYQPEEEFYE